jgi:hypothetical protein
MKRRRWMKKNFGRCFFVGITILSLVFLGGCAGSKTYLLNLRYDASKTPSFVTGATQPVTLAVYNIQDARPDRMYLGRWVYRDGTVDFFKPDAGSVEQVVTKAFINLLEKAGFKVVPANRYLDPTKEDFKDIPADAAFGGTLEALWVEAKKGVVATDSSAKMRLRIHWGIVKTRTWMTKTIEADAQESDRPLYGPTNAEAMINEVFRDGLDKLLKDEATLRGIFLGSK